jgi:hypothetical protein
MALRNAPPTTGRDGNVETVPFCADRGACPGRCPELAQDVLQVGGHGPRGYDERASDLLVGAPLDQEAQHLHLPRRQPVQVSRG